MELVFGQTDRQTEESPTEVRDAQGVSVKRSPHPFSTAGLSCKTLCTFIPNNALLALVIRDTRVGRIRSNRASLPASTIGVPVADTLLMFSVPCPCPSKVAEVL